MVSLFSAIFIVILFIGGLSYLFFEREYMDTIFLYGIMLFTVPFLIWQFVIPANIGFLNDSKIKGYPFYVLLIVFIFVDMLFFASVNSLFEIVPHVPRRLEVSLEYRETMRASFIKQSWFYISSMYVALTGSGFLVRFLRNRFF